MDWIVITGVKPYDGRYPLEFADEDGELTVTTREWGWIKRLAGYHPMTFEDGLRNNDPELLTALAVIAMRRADKIDRLELPAVFEKLADAPFGSKILFESDTAEEVDTAVSDPPGSSTGSERSSGTGSPTDSETLVLPPPNGSGIHASAVSVSDRQMWET